MSSATILITDCDHGAFSEEEGVVTAAGHRLRVAACRSEEDVIRYAGNAEAIICQYAPVTAAVLRALPRCRVVGRYGVGLDNVDVAAATALGIKVVHTPQFCLEEVATHTIGLILALSRRIVLLDRALRRDPEGFTARWDSRTELLRGTGRPGAQTVGVVGYGRVGRLVALRAIALGFTVVAHDVVVPARRIAADGVGACGLEGVLDSSDFVTLHIPLDEATRGLIGAPQIGLMKPTACLINTSRGGVVDEEALIVALRTERIGGAALDVLRSEPFPPRHPFLAMDKVILTPHIAYYSDASIEELKRQVAQYVVNALAGVGEYAIANPEVEAGSRI